MRLIVVWLLNTVALLGLTWMMPAIHVTWSAPVLRAALLLGLINAPLPSLFSLLARPLTRLLATLLVLALNGLLFCFAGSLTEGVTVDGYWPAVFAAALYSVIAWQLCAAVSARY